jgi:hypothetical protein
MELISKAATGGGVGGGGGSMGLDPGSFLHALNHKVMHNTVQKQTFVSCVL